MEQTCQTAYQIYLNHNELMEDINISKRKDTIIFFIQTFINNDHILNYVESTYLLITLKHMCHYISFSEDDLFEIISELSKLDFIGINQKLLDEAMKELFK